MSGWDRWGGFTPAPKRPPPERGIKMKKCGATWWGLRWVEALRRISRGYSNRLARGKTYARAGRTHDLVIEGGKVTAQVTGSRSKPYEVTITLPQLTDKTWDAAIAAMAEKAQFSAELLAGQMPLEIDSVFRGAGASLFPVRETDLGTDCSCPDWANPCKHVAATHYVLGEAFDRDPFLLFELRGRTQARVLAALRAARAGEGDSEAAAPDEEGIDGGMDAGTSVPHVTLDPVDPAAWDAPPQALPSLQLAFERPSISGGILRQLGTPSDWSGPTSPTEALGPLIRAAADRARAMAMAEPPTTPEPDEAPAEKTSETRTATKKATTKKAARSKKPATRKAETKKAANEKTARSKKPATRKTPTQKAPTGRKTSAREATRLTAEKATRNSAAKKKVEGKRIPTKKPPKEKQVMATENPPTRKVLATKKPPKNKKVADTERPSKKRKGAAAKEPPQDKDGR